MFTLSKFCLGSAIGFRLDSLLKLTETRARNNKMTLMHYLCKVHVAIYLLFVFCSFLCLVIIGFLLCYGVNYDIKFK